MNQKIEKRYELTDVTIPFHGRVLRQIRALQDFGRVKAGDLGGYIESERNLRQNCTAWVHPDSYVYDRAEVFGNAQISNGSDISGCACVFDNASVSGISSVMGSAQIFGNAHIYGGVSVFGHARIGGHGMISSPTDYLYVVGLGMEAPSYRSITAFRDKNELVAVSCDSFCGGIGDFYDVIQTQQEYAPFREEYFAFAELARIHFSSMHQWQPLGILQPRPTEW